MPPLGAFSATDRAAHLYMWLSLVLQISLIYLFGTTLQVLWSISKCYNSFILLIGGCLMGQTPPVMH